MGIFGDDDGDYASNEHQSVQRQIEVWYRDVYPRINENNVARAAKFEYLVLEDIDEATLDEKGALGWELVNFTSYAVGFGIGLNGISNEQMTVHFRFVFKRPVFIDERVQTEWDEIHRLRARKAELAREL